MSSEIFRDSETRERRLAGLRFWEVKSISRSVIQLQSLDSQRLYRAYPLAYPVRCTIDRNSVWRWFRSLADVAFFARHCCRHGSGSTCSTGYHPQHNRSRAADRRRQSRWQRRGLDHGAGVRETKGPATILHHRERQAGDEAAGSRAEHLELHPQVARRLWRQVHNRRRQAAYYGRGGQERKEWSNASGNG